MANHDAKLGAGLATGMFYHAPAGTALPEYPSKSLDEAWKEVGDVSDAGMTLTMDLSTETIKNWANRNVRIIQSEHSETAQAAIIDTTEESLKTVLGANAVTTEEASADHGKLIKAKLARDALPPEEAYLFLMKDEDDMLMVGCTNGQITALEAVTFAPGETINWTPTITALGDGWQLITDDGKKSEAA